MLDCDWFSVRATRLWQERRSKPRPQAQKYVDYTTAAPPLKLLLLAPLLAPLVATTSLGPFTKNSVPVPDSSQLKTPGKYTQGGSFFVANMWYIFFQCFHSISSQNLMFIYHDLFIFRIWTFGEVISVLGRVFKGFWWLLTVYNHCKHTTEADIRIWWLYDHCKFSVLKGCLLAAEQSGFLRPIFSAAKK